MFSSSFLRLLKISCPLCTLQKQQILDESKKICYKSCDVQLTETFRSVSKFQRHLRNHHQLSLFEDEINRKEHNHLLYQAHHQSVETSNKSIMIIPPSRKTRRAVRNVSSLSHFQDILGVKNKNNEKRHQFYFSSYGNRQRCTSQTNGDVLSSLCRMYARIACGLLPLLHLQESSSSSQKQKHYEKTSSMNSYSYCPLLFIDFANQPDIFDNFQQIDPGAELFLRRRGVIICIWEPRVSISRLLDSPFARNAMRRGRIFVHQCRRDRESGDLAMADVIARVTFEIRQTIYRECEEEQSVPFSSSALEQVKYHIIGNDLRHRRCLQDLVGKDFIVGHHAFENTAFSWEKVLSNLIRNCLPCLCGEVHPLNTKFPHAELGLNLSNAEKF